VIATASTSLQSIFTTLTPLGCYLFQRKDVKLLLKMETYENSVRLHLYLTCDVVEWYGLGAGVRSVQYIFSDTIVLLTPPEPPLDEIDPYQYFGEAITKNRSKTVTSTGTTDARPAIGETLGDCDSQYFFAEHIHDNNANDNLESNSRLLSSARSSLKRFTLFKAGEY